MLWQLTLWSICFCLGILCIQLHPALSLDHPVLHSHIPMHVFVLDITNLPEDFANLLCVCACLDLREFCAGDNSPLSSCAVVCCEIPRGCAATHSADPKTWSKHFPLHWGPSPCFHPTYERRKGSFWCQDLLPQNWHDQNHCQISQ